MISSHLDQAGTFSAALVRNQAETARLAKFAALTADELRLVVHDEWTIAAKLGHLAFWDRFVLATLGRWATRQEFRAETPHWYDDVLNESVLVESLALDPETALRLAMDAASALDARLAGLGPEECARLEADAANPETDANWLLHRYRHRGEHLNEIEQALAVLVK